MRGPFCVGVFKGVALEGAIYQILRYRSAVSDCKLTMPLEITLHLGADAESTIFLDF